MWLEGTTVCREATWMTSGNPEPVLDSVVAWLRRRSARKIVRDPGSVSARIGRLRDGYRRPALWPMSISVTVTAHAEETSVAAMVRSDMRMRLGTERGYARGVDEILATVREAAGGTAP
jgi:hypothetical protein